MDQRSLCCSCAVLSWFCGLMSSQYLTSMRWMSRWRILRSLGRCCLGKVNLLMAGGAAEMLLVSLSRPLPLLSSHPPNLLLFLFSQRWGKVKVKVYAGSHQRALRKGFQLVLTLARAHKAPPPKTRKCQYCIKLRIPKYYQTLTKNGTANVAASNAYLTTSLLKPSAQSWSTMYN